MAIEIDHALQRVRHRPTAGEALGLTQNDVRGKRERAARHVGVDAAGRVVRPEKDRDAFAVRAGDSVTGTTERQRAEVGVERKVIPVEQALRIRGKDQVVVGTGAAHALPVEARSPVAVELRAAAPGLGRGDRTRGEAEQREQTESRAGENAWASERGHWSSPIRDCDANQASSDAVATFGG